MSEGGNRLYPAPHLTPISPPDVLYPEVDGKKSGISVVTERLVAEGCWFNARVGHLRIEFTTPTQIVV